VIFDLTIQAMADPIYDLFAERMRFKIHSLEEILSSYLQQDEGEGEGSDASLSDSSILAAPQEPWEHSPEDLAELENEYSWFQNFYSKIQDIRNSKGIPASVKWNRMKRGDPLLNERSTLNYIKSMEENHR
jgi:hypothetical protein